MGAGYGVTTEGEVALTAALTYVLGIRAGAAFELQLCEFSISFDGVTATAEPVPVELCYATFATNPPGTNSTTVTPGQHYGRANAHGMTAAKLWTLANPPTVVTRIRSWEISPFGGLFVYQFAETRRPDTALNDGFILRATPPAAVNCLAELLVERY